MKRILMLSFLTVLFIMLYTAATVPPNPTEPQTPARSCTDADLRFSVKTDTGVETVTMADYLPGVLAGEMPALFEAQALMAQAVAARTYILHRVQNGSSNHPDADICNDSACCKAYVSEEQMRKNWGTHYDAYHAKITDAVVSTDGQYLTYNGELIEAVFHSSSAGATEASESIWNARPYLVSVNSPETEEDVPNYISQTSLSSSLLRSQLAAQYSELKFSETPEAWLTDFVRNDSVRVQTVKVCNLTLTGAQLRSALDLRSTSFTVEYADDTFTFHVTGYGHGVGMSQYGANVFAKQGMDYRQILTHYYPNTQLASTSE